MTDFFQGNRSAIWYMVEEAELKKQALAEIELDAPAPPEGGWQA